MLTLLLYVVIIAVIAALLFFVASVVFGRGEELEPLPEGTTATVLPAEGVTGEDVGALRFQQTLRGYKPSEVDWVLDRLGAEIDLLRSRVAAGEIAADPASPEA
jgi:DivIVA domain-containing protein